MMKLLSATLLCACGGAAMAAAPDMFWFKNETQCGDAKVVVRSYCEVAQRTNAVMQVNNGCTEQELVIAQPGKKVVKRDLLEHEPVGDDFHIASGLRCVEAGTHSYLLVTLDTGGSCDTCEIQALLALDGRWKRYGSKWQSTPASEQHEIRLRESSWKRVPSYPINNTVLEDPKARAEPCSAPDPAVLRSTWQSFRNATLAGQPEQVARYYKFPVQLLPPMDGMKPMKITRPVFIKHYAELFQRGPADTEIAMLTAMKKSTGKEYIPQPQFDSTKCRYKVPTRIEDYNFVYDKNAGWLVESLYYDNNDLELARSSQLDRL